MRCPPVQAGRQLANNKVASSKREGKFRFIAPPPLFSRTQRLTTRVCREERKALLGSTVLGLLLGDAGLALSERPLGSVPTFGLFDFGLLGLLGSRVLADGLVDADVEGLEVVGLDSVLDVFRELLLIALGIALLQVPHVVSNVAAEEVLAEDFGVEFLRFGVIASEARIRVGDVEAAVASALESRENPRTGGGTGKTDVEAGLEGLGAVNAVEIVVPVLAGDLDLSLVPGGKAKLREMPAGQEEASGIARGVICETSLKPIARQFVRIGSGHDNVSLDLGICDLANHILVGEPHDEPVFGAVVLVLGLVGQPLAGAIISLALTPSPVLDLVALEVGLVLDNLHEAHDEEEGDEDGKGEERKNVQPHVSNLKR